MEDELWMRKIKERLEDYSEPLPVSGWERLEKDLPVGKLSLEKERRIAPFRRWTLAAAAALLVAVSSVSVWFLRSSVGEEVRTTAVPTLATVPRRLPEQQLPLAEVVKISEPGYGTRKQLSSAVAALPLKSLPPLPEQEAETKEDISPEVKETVSAESNRAESPTVVRRPSGRDKLHLPVADAKKKNSRGWSVALAVGNTGGLTSANNANVSGDNMNGSSLGYPDGKVDLNAIVNGIMDVPEGQQLVFKDGIPYLMKNSNQITDIHHKQPLSFGLSVRKGLAKGFSVETGLTYTYLSSDVTFAGSPEKLSQKLHYLGIPLRANWNFVDKKSFVMYLSAGGAMEKCVYGKIGTRNETVKPLQFSVMGAVGVQYNVNSRLGIYVEPGVSHFFDDGSDIQTIRKENPCNFTLQGGIRLTY